MSNMVTDKRFHLSFELGHSGVVPYCHMVNGDSVIACVSFSLYGLVNFVYNHVHRTCKREKEGETTKGDAMGLHLWDR